MKHCIRRSARLLRSTVTLLAVAGVVLSAGYAKAADIALPPMNLGDTSFQDGIAFPGLLVEEMIGYYHGNQINDANGDKIPGNNKLSTISANTHVAYITNYKILGGYYGAELLLPLADVDLDTSFGPNQRTRGVGDLTISPFILQWTDHKLFGMPYFHRFVLDITLPTGAYSSTRAVNAGNNMVSINPYYAFTIMPTEKAEISARLHYLWNSENDSPFFALNASDTQPGQVFHANYAASYEVAKGLRLGLNGYVLQQLTDDKIDGKSQSNSRERVFGIGPGLQYSTNGVMLYLNSYLETGAENRPEGTKFVFRLSKAF